MFEFLAEILGAVRPTDDCCEDDPEPCSECAGTGLSELGDACLYCNGTGQRY